MVETKKLGIKELAELANSKSIWFPSAEIYSGNLAGFWDFGPYGESIRRKVIDFWRKELVQKENCIECFGSVILGESVFIASGHISNFNDPLTQCKECKSVHRADNLLTEHLNVNFTEGMPTEHFDKMIIENKLKCPACKGDLGKVIRFNLLMKTEIGAAGGKPGYLRGEACQNIFLNFDRLFKTMRQTLPCAIAQAGEAFRNEINPRNSLIRSREFGQMDVEVFFNPNKINEVENFDAIKNYKLMLMQVKQEIKAISCQEAIDKKIISGKLIAHWLAKIQQFYNKIGIPIEAMRFRELDSEERAFYAKECWDFEVLIEGKWIELVADNYRTDFDLSRHGKESKKDLSVTEEGHSFVPHIFEMSAGINRTMYAIMYFALNQRDERNVLSINSRLAPYQIAIFPLVKKDGIKEIATDLFNDLLDHNFDVFYDEKGSIGRRYSRMDEIGCPFCLTVDYDTKENQTITIRERDSMQQKRIKISDLNYLLFDLIAGKKKFDDLK